MSPIDLSESTEACRLTSGARVMAVAMLHEPRGEVLRDAWCDQVRGPSQRVRSSPALSTVPSLISRRLM